MYDLLMVLHSWLRWVVLALAVWTILENYKGWKSDLAYNPTVKKWNTFFIASLHTQLVIGLILYLFVSPMMQNILSDFGASMKNSETRFWSVEHIFGMILGIAIAQIGSIKSKKQATDSAKYEVAFKWFLAGFIIILLMIPFGIWNIERPFFRF
ncbi:MAG: hypothetical protein WBO44_10240 [Saprospiraceae bacterium]